MFISLCALCHFSVTRDAEEMENTSDNMENPLSPMDIDMLVAHTNAVHSYCESKPGPSNRMHELLSTQVQVLCTMHPVRHIDCVVAYWCNKVNRPKKKALGASVAGPAACRRHALLLGTKKSRQRCFWIQIISKLRQKGR